ncbi:hypothetical protein SCHPADRAFT_579849 [Schizopora paradoxa]|uniref:Uncharacterized protein n=1 Tax=Schizopora paradoxa TaxID=27342 RepID=A0A0H2RCA0_9AGAM|nr:hypothetical protein SCHPADRAFT_579849 [Schizopora paradoxa]
MSLASDYESDVLGTSRKDPLKVAAGLKATLKSSRTSEAAKERAKRRLDGIAGSTAQLISAQDATTVARDLHKEETKGAKDPSFDEQARINQIHLQSHKRRPEPGPSTRTLRVRDRQVGFIDEQQTVDEYKSALRSAKTPKATKEVVRERLVFHREI